MEWYVWASIWWFHKSHQIHLVLSVASSLWWSHQLGFLHGYVIRWYGIDLNWCVLSLSLSEKSWITKHALWTNVSLFRSFFTICIDRLQTINYHKSVHIESNIICSHKKKIGAFFLFLSLSLFSSHFKCVRVSCVFCVCIFHLVSQMCDHHHHNSIWFDLKWNAGALLKIILQLGHTYRCVSSLKSIKATFVYNFRIIIYWLWPYLDAVFFMHIHFERFNNLTSKNDNLFRYVEHFNGLC